MGLTYRPLAEKDLDELWLTIALDSPRRADDYLDALHQRCLNLAKSPKIGQPAEEIGTGIWVFPLDHYLIFYEMTENGIDIVRFWNASRDTANLFVDDAPEN